MDLDLASGYDIAVVGTLISDCCQMESSPRLICAWKPFSQAPFFLTDNAKVIWLYYIEFFAQDVSCHLSIDRTWRYHFAKKKSCHFIFQAIHYGLFVVSRENYLSNTSSAAFDVLLTTAIKAERHSCRKAMNMHFYCQTYSQVPLPLFSLIFLGNIFNRQKKMEERWADQKQSLIFRSSFSKSGQPSSKWQSQQKWSRMDRDRSLASLYTSGEFFTECFYG